MQRPGLSVSELYVASVSPPGPWLWDVCTGQLAGLGWPCRHISPLPTGGLEKAGRRRQLQALHPAAPVWEPVQGAFVGLSSVDVDCPCLGSPQGSGRPSGRATVFFFCDELYIGCCLLWLGSHGCGPCCPGLHLPHLTPANWEARRWLSPQHSSLDGPFPLWARLRARCARTEGCSELPSPGTMPGCAQHLTKPSICWLPPHWTKATGSWTRCRGTPSHPPAVT